MIERFSEGMSDGALAQRGQQARRLLEDDVLELAFAMAETGFIEEWVHDDYDENKSRRLHTNIQSLSEIRTQLRIIQDDGEVAEDRLNDEDLSSE